MRCPRELLRTTSIATAATANTSGKTKVNAKRMDIRNESFDQLQATSGKRPSGVRPIRPITLTTAAATAMESADHRRRGNIIVREIAQTEQRKQKNQIAPSMVTDVIELAFSSMVS